MAEYLAVLDVDGFIGFQPAGYKANYMDVSVKYVGIISGVGNTIGTIAGPILVALRGVRVMEHGVVECLRLQFVGSSTVYVLLGN